MAGTTAFRRMAAGCGIALALAQAPAASADVHFHDGAGLHVVSVKHVNPRLLAVVVATKALPQRANVYVLLPPDYAQHPHRRWPVFYLLHGTSGTASDWTAQGDAENVIGDRELITVMPDIGLGGDGGGWCTDWPNGQEAWETFHVGELIPWVDANLRTIRARGKRAIAGLSQGGFCSMSYAARHPDLFGVALAYSGAPDIYYDPDVRVGAMLVINGTEMGLTHVPPDTFFGDPVTNGINWAAHDPATLAPNLRATRMYLYWGSGQPGPYDSPSSGLPGEMAIEGGIAQSNADFERRLESLGIRAYFDAYGAGTHAWPYWTRDLQWSIDRIMSDFAHPAPRPARVTFTSADSVYDVYGWRVALLRESREFSTLAGASCRGFSLSGSGTATVVTPRCLRSGARYRVACRGPHAHSTRVLVAARRRLSLDVPLGPGGSVSTTSVTIRRLR